MVTVYTRSGIAESLGSHHVWTTWEPLYFLARLCPCSAQNPGVCACRNSIQSNMYASLLLIRIFWHFIWNNAPSWQDNNPCPIHYFISSLCENSTCRRAVYTEVMACVCLILVSALYFLAFSRNPYSFWYCLSACVSARLSVYTVVCLSVNLPTSLSEYLSVSVCLPTCIFLLLSAYIHVSLSVCLYVCPSVCLCIHVCMYVSITICTCLHVWLFVCQTLRLSHTHTHT